MRTHRVRHLYECVCVCVRVFLLPATGNVSGLLCVCVFARFCACDTDLHSAWKSHRERVFATSKVDLMLYAENKKKQINTHTTRKARIFERYRNEHKSRSCQPRHHTSLLSRQDAPSNPAHLVEHFVTGRPAKIRSKLQCVNWIGKQFELNYNHHVCGLSANTISTHTRGATARRVKLLAQQHNGNQHRYI